MADEKAGFELTVPAPFECELNGLRVEFDNDLVFRILPADSVEQAIEFAHIHNLPVDYNAFAYFDEANQVHVTFSGKDGSRIEESAADRAQREADAAAAAEAESDTVAPEPVKVSEDAQVDVTTPQPPVQETPTFPQEGEGN